MAESEEIKGAVKGGTVFVNCEALNSWLRFGTTSPPVENSDHRPLAGAELLRWAGQRSRSQKSHQRGRKD